MIIERKSILIFSFSNTINTSVLLLSFGKSFQLGIYCDILICDETTTIYILNNLKVSCY